MRITMFGGLRLLGGQGETVRLRSRQAETLFALLALSPGHVFPRTELIERLWPDTDPDTGRSRLKQELAVLRRALQTVNAGGAEILRSDGMGIALLSGSWDTDVACFLDSLHSAGVLPGLDERIEAFSRAFSLAHSPLLPGCYEDGIVRERERLAQIQNKALCRFARLAAASGELSRAREAALRAVQGDPFAEEPRALRMALSLWSGLPEEALREFHAYAALLAEELADTPPPALQALAQQCHTAASAPEALLALRHLSPPLLRLLHSLAALPPVWSLTEAETVSQDPGLLSHLALLEEKGLLLSESEDNSIRFRLAVFLLLLTPPL